MAERLLTCILFVLLCEDGLATCQFASCIYIWNIGVLLGIAERELPKNVTPSRLCETWGKMVPGISLDPSLCGLKAVHDILHDV